MAYRTGVRSRRQLTWVDRTGKALGTVGAPDDNGPPFPSVSRDGHRAVVSRTVQGNIDLWRLDGPHTSRFTFDAALDQLPIWSPDGRFLPYYSVDPQTGRDLWVLPMDLDPTPRVFLQTPFFESFSTFSPDGCWVAYQSNESGRTEIYVRPFAASAAPGAGATAAGGQWQVSTAGGISPRWRSDGRELYYLAPSGALMAAPIAVTGPSVASGAPVELFPTRIVGGGTDSDVQGRQYDVTRDGRFLINTVLDEAAAPITLLMNWAPEAKQ